MIFWIWSILPLWMRLLTLLFQSCLQFRRGVLGPSTLQNPQNQRDLPLEKKRFWHRNSNHTYRKQLQRWHIDTWVSSALTVHVYLLAQLNQLHFSGHVSHRSHAVSEVFTANEPIFVLVKLFEGIPQLCWATNEIFWVIEMHGSSAHIKRISDIIC